MTDFTENMAEYPMEEGSMEPVNPVEEATDDLDMDEIAQALNAGVSHGENAVFAEPADSAAGVDDADSSGNAVDPDEVDVAADLSISDSIDNAVGSDETEGADSAEDTSSVDSTDSSGNVADSDDAEISDGPSASAGSAGEEDAQAANPPATKRRRRAKAEEKAEEEAADGSESTDQASKMEAAGASGMSRAEVLEDARKRAMERTIERQERQRFLTGWTALTTAMHRHTIVNGIVASVEIRHIGDPDEVSEDLVLLAVMLDGGYKVLMPFEEFYQENPIDMQTVSLDTIQGQRELTRRKRAIAEKLYELEIPLIITDMEINDRDENGAYNYAIVGSRRRALDILEAQNFGDQNGSPRIHEGDMVSATITSVSIYSIAVVIGGVDTRIPFRLLTYRYLLDARTVYHVGQQITVYVHRITERPDGRHNLVVDARVAELQSARLRQSLLPVGTSTLGVITTVWHMTPTPERPEGRLRILAYLKMYNMPALVRSIPVSYLGREPIAGDEIRVVVVGHAKSGFIIADCRSFNGAPGLLNH